MKINFQACLQDREGDQSKISRLLPFFEKNKCSYIYKHFLSKDWEILCLILCLIRVRIANFSWGGTKPLHLPPPKCIWSKPHLLAYTSFCSDSCQYAIRFSRTLIDTDLSTSGIGPDNLMNVLKNRVIFFIRVACFVFFFHCKQKQCFSV